VHGDSTPMDMTCDLETTTTRDVRHRVRDLLTGRAGVVVDDAVLVADELVSNAHRHGTAPRVCRLGLIHQGRCLRIEVDDASPHEPKIRTPDRSGGRGLVLIDRLASSWGVYRHGHHKTVWAELVLDRTGSSGHAPYLKPARTWSRLTPRL
jgi:two-component sensor histidine kinase